MSHLPDRVLATAIVPRRELTLCRVAGITDDGLGLIEAPGSGALLEAVSLITLSCGDVGRTAAVWFPDDHPPVVAGLVQPPHDPGQGLAPGDAVLESGRTLTLRCGEASIALHADGRVVISGTELLSRAVGPIRLKGGSIDLN